MITLRLLRAIAVTLSAYSIVFFLVFAAGDPALGQLGGQARPAQIEQFRHQHGLDAPLFEIYVGNLQRLVRLDFGRTYSNRRPVGEVIWERLPRTLLLGSMAVSLEVLFGVSIGIAAALRRNRAFDTVAMALSFIGMSAPTFLLGILLLYVVAFRLSLLPVGGYGTTALEHCVHAILPAVTIAIAGTSTYARLMRSELIETLRADYVRTARAMGLGEWEARRRAIRNAIIPVTTLLGMSLPLLVSGAVVTEQVYQWPGLGRLAVESIVTRDVPTVLAIVFVSSIAVQLGNLLADVAVALLDPRVRPGANGQR